MPKKIFPFIIICLSFIGCQNKTAEQDNDINWAKGAVWYQIFPERFRNGDPANDPTVAEVPETENPQSWIWTKADSAFLRLIKEAHLRDIKIVIDGVFNHSGLEFFAFKDIVQNGKDSRYVDWYTITAWDDASEWITDKRMDNTMNYLFSKVVVDFFIDQKTAISAIKFSDRLQEIIALYGNETSLLLWNLIDSHDTDRLASMIINPDRDYDRNGGLRDNPDYLVRKPNNDEIKILKQIVAFQMTFIGAPVIYYGDEAGMWGADDPCDRKPMLWADLDYDLEKSHALPGKTRPADQNKFDSQLFNYYKSMIELRKTNPALKIGNVEFLSEINQKDMFGFSRATEDQQILVIFNRSSSQQEIKIAQKNILYQEYFNPQNDIHYQTQDEGLVLTIPENWYAILISN